MGIYVFYWQCHGNYEHKQYVLYSFAPTTVMNTIPIQVLFLELVKFQGPKHQAPFIGAPGQHFWSVCTVGEISTQTCPYQLI